MYIMVRKYSGKARLLEGLAPQIRDGLVPVLMQGAGFRHYSVFASEDGHIVSVSVFDDQQSAYRASEAIRQWVAAHLRDALPEPPETLAGHALREIPPEQAPDAAAGLYVAIRQWDGVRSPERMIALADEHVMPAIRQAPGLLCHYIFTNAQDPRRVNAVSLLDSRENALRVSDQVAAIVRDKARDVAPNPPRITLGKALVAVTR